MPVNGMPLYYISSLSTGGDLLLEITEFSESGDSSVIIYNARAVSFTQRVRGTWIDTVTGSAGTYPDDGISGNYWYVLSAPSNDTAFANVGGTIYKVTPFKILGFTTFKITSINW